MSGTALKYGGRLMSKLHHGLFIRVWYGLFIRVWSFGYGVVFSFYGGVFSFGYETPYPNENTIPE